MVRKYYVAIVGCGKAGLEHARTLNRYFPSVTVVRIVDINERNLSLAKQILGDSYQKSENKLPSGFIIDSRPYAVRVAEPIQLVADNIFESYSLVEEKPASPIDLLKPQKSDEFHSRYLNVQRVHTPGWQAFRSKCGIPQEVICVERNPAFKKNNAEIIGDFLPHAASFAFDLFSGTLESIDKINEGHIILKFSCGGSAAILFKNAARPSCSVLVDAVSSDHSYHWPNGTSMHSSHAVLPFFSIFRSNLDLLTKMRIKLVVTYQYLFGITLYDDFRFSWHKIFNSDTHQESQQIRNQRLLSAKYFSPNNSTSEGNCDLLASGKRYDLVIIGGSGYIGSRLCAALPHLSVLVVGRSNVSACPEKYDLVSINKFLAAVETISYKKVILMSSAMLGDFPAHHAHNSMLQKLIPKIEEAQVMLLSSRTIYVVPGRKDSPTHTLESARKRGPYSYGKLLDETLVHREISPQNLTILHPGVVAAREDLKYGVAFGLGSFVFVAASPKSSVPFSDIANLTERLKQWVESREEVTDITEYIPMRDYCSERYSEKIVIYIPHILVKLGCLCFQRIYQGARPLEDLYNRFKHFYA